MLAAACAVILGTGMAGPGPFAAVAQSPQTLSEAAYEALLAEAKAHENPVAYDAALTSILNRSDLSDYQRGKTLFERATRRWKDGMDKLGALDDFEAILAIDANHPFANNAKIEKGWAEDEIIWIEQQHEDLQTIAEWFDGVFSLGRHDEAVARYRKSGISPTPLQVQTMMAFGYICEDRPDAPKLHQFGPERPDLANLHWCGPAAAMPGPDKAPRLLTASAPATGSPAPGDGKNAAARKDEAQPAIAVAGP
ncbi:hypothetical protein D1223_13230 [Henriciella mobilis]|uniref:Uncharacterized protein n=1 Tax=Henriciella mobilis TaxID=2305467 RepID=A0A399RA84_9PROT|nr:hypothetical protein D1223_13230 [Henriciella mobilis]